MGTVDRKMTRQERESVRFLQWASESCAARILIRALMGRCPQLQWAVGEHKPQWKWGPSSAALDVRRPPSLAYCIAVTPIAHARDVMQISCNTIVVLALFFFVRVPATFVRNLSLEKHWYQEPPRPGWDFHLQFESRLPLQVKVTTALAQVVRGGLSWNSGIILQKKLFQMAVSNVTLHMKMLMYLT